jgi:hypothetical protein
MNQENSVITHQFKLEKDTCIRARIALQGLPKQGLPKPATAAELQRFASMILKRPDNTRDGIREYMRVLSYATMFVALSGTCDPKLREAFARFWLLVQSSKLLEPYEVKNIEELPAKWAREYTESDATPSVIQFRNWQWTEDFDYLLGAPPGVRNCGVEEVLNAVFARYTTSESWSMRCYLITYLWRRCAGMGGQGPTELFRCLNVELSLYVCTPKPGTATWFDSEPNLYVDTDFRLDDDEPSYTSSLKITGDMKLAEDELVGNIHARPPQGLGIGCVSKLGSDTSQLQPFYAPTSNSRHQQLSPNLQDALVEPELCLTKPGLEFGHGNSLEYGTGRWPPVDEPGVHQYPSSPVPEPLTQWCNPLHQYPAQKPYPSLAGIEMPAMYDKNFTPGCPTPPATDVKLHVANDELFRVLGITWEVLVVAVMHIITTYTTWEEKTHKYLMYASIPSPGTWKESEAKKETKSTKTVVIFPGVVHSVLGQLFGLGNRHHGWAHKSYCPTCRRTWLAFTTRVIATIINPENPDSHNLCGDDHDLMLSLSIYRQGTGTTPMLTLSQEKFDRLAAMILPRNPGIDKNIARLLRRYVESGDDITQLRTRARRHPVHGLPATTRLPKDVTGFLAHLIRILYSEQSTWKQAHWSGLEKLGKRALVDPDRRDGSKKRNITDTPSPPALRY